jgi:uncharacterized damage-inducible protein DinB
MMTNEQLTVRMAMASWQNTVGRADKTFGALTEEQFHREVAPGKNRIIYLLGHLTAINDAMHPILGIGERLHPELDSMFISEPDRANEVLPSVRELRKDWADVNGSLSEKLARFTPQDWLQRHTAVSDEDYAKDPSRNRLTVLLSRTNHLSYHLGQIILARR